ncbi:MAG: bifunctional heptose 7-phosphate kinase/heptose 1-phosphate adenyltransferase [Bacteroidia bacterium]
MDVANFLSAAKGKKLLVVGDLMIDRYLWGKVDRISPEAPVPVVAVQKEENRLGGAANVALNLQSLGATVSLAGLIGQDEMGSVLQQEMQKKGFALDWILPLASRRTTVKTRILGNHQQMIRVDKEDTFSPQKHEIKAWQSALSAVIADQDAIILQDYDKGSLFPELIQAIIEHAKQANVPLLVDPKREHFFDFAGATVFKPNLRELNDGLGLKLKNVDLAGIQQAILQLRQQMAHEHSFVTLSENGALYISPLGERHHIPAHPRQISDVSGAGDTVISVLSLGYAIGASPLESAQIANLAGGLVCEEVGVVPIRPERLISVK